MAMTRAPRLPLLAVAAVSALAGALPAAAAAGSGPPPADCPLWAVHPKVEHAIPGTNLTARDPYGGLLARNRLFFSFSVRGADSDLANVASVTWALDGTVKRTDDTKPFQWAAQSGSSKRMPAGDHTITVTVTPKAGGPPATTSFALTATDCQPAGFYPEVPKARGSSFYNFQSAIERGGGPDLDGVALEATTNVKASLPRALRGRKIGTLFISGERAGTGKTYTLKGGSVALSRGSLRVRFVPGAKRFLRVTGLPAGIKNVQIRLLPGITQLRSPTKAFRVTGSLTAGDTTVRTAGGGTYV